MTMQSLKNIFINSAMILALLFGIVCSAIASDNFYENNLLSKATNQGDAFSQYEVAIYYLKGEVIRQDYSKAILYLKKSANQKNIHSQFELGLLYDTGESVKQDKTHAKEWYGKACDNGYRLGCMAYRMLNQQGY